MKNEKKCNSLHQEEKAKLKVQFFSKANGQYLQPGSIVEIIGDRGDSKVCLFEQCYYVIPTTSLEILNENDKQTTIYDFLEG